MDSTAPDSQGDPGFRLDPWRALYVGHTPPSSSGSHTEAGRLLLKPLIPTHSAPCRGRPGAFLSDSTTRKSRAAPTKLLSWSRNQTVPETSAPAAADPAFPGAPGRDETPTPRQRPRLPSDWTREAWPRGMAGRLDSPQQHGHGNFLGPGPGQGVWPAPRLLQSALTELRCPRHRLPRTLPHTHVLPTTSSPRSRPVTSQSHRTAPIKRESTETASRQVTAKGQEAAG